MFKRLIELWRHRHDEPHRRFWVIYEPWHGYEGEWVVYEMLPFGADLYPHYRTTCSSKESAYMYVANLGELHEDQ